MFAATISSIVLCGFNLSTMHHSQFTLMEKEENEASSSSSRKVASKSSRDEAMYTEVRHPEQQQLLAIYV